VRRILPDDYRPARVESLTLDASGFTFDALAAGPAGGRVVLLLHGFPQTSRSWRAVAGQLAEAGHRVVAPDLRGYSPGARPEAVEAYASAVLAGDVAGFADALGQEQVDVVGHDWGAAVAWQAAARLPERVRTLTAVSVPHPVPFTHALSTDADQRERSSYMVLFRRQGKAEQVLSRDDWRPLRAMYQGIVPAEEIEHYVAVLAGGALTPALNYYRAASTRDLEGLGEIRAPTLYVWSTEDVAIGRAAAEACAEHVGAPYRFLELDGVSHWVPDEAPGELAAAIVEHLAATPPRLTG
jgi:pimeloyl-ACP methyl ester carboxylesterase